MSFPHSDKYKIHVLLFSPQILSVVGGDALSCQIVLFNLEETSVYNNDDMKIDVSMGCVKIVFLNWFVNSVLVSVNPNTLCFT